MSLTKIKTEGVTDDAITSGKIPANAVGSSELANNAVDTDAIADQAVALSKLPHGDGSSNGKFLRANNGADPSFETVNTDLVADTSPQLGGTLDVNSQSISFATDKNLILKTGATNAVVNGVTQHVEQGSLTINGGSNDIFLDCGGKTTFGSSDGATHEVMRIQNSVLGNSTHGKVFLNYVTANAGGTTSSATKLTTTSTGVYVYGGVTASGGVSATGAVSATTTISDSKGDLRAIPKSDKSSAYTIVSADSGTVLYTQAGITVPYNTVAAGTTVTVINTTSSNITITQASSMVLNNSADATTGNRTLAGKGMATIYFANSQNAFISGAGLS